MKLATRNGLFAGFLLLIVVLALPTISELTRFSLDSRNTAVSQIVLVPFVAAFLIGLRRRRIFSDVRFGVVSGISVVGAGLGVALAARSLAATLDENDQLAVEAAALVLLIIGGFIAFYGTRAFRSALFPLCFLVFSIPIPHFILDPTIAFLRAGSAEVAYAMLRLTGTPVYREGFVFNMPNLVIEVAPECSGIRSGIGMVMTSLIGGYLLLESRWSRAVLVLAAMPLLIFKNAVRIDTLSLLTLHVDPGIMGSRLHQEGGVFFFALGLLLLYPVLLFLVRSEGTSRVSLHSVPANRSL